jgi:DNA-binding NarL/FixJ family response regulator
LTEREQEILHPLATGATSKETGQQLNLTMKTVENLRSRILSKLNMTNTVAAVVFAGQQEPMIESLP